jgi:hypothetical protein
MISIFPIVNYISLSWCDIPELVVPTMISLTEWLAELSLCDEMNERVVFLIAKINVMNSEIVYETASHTNINMVNNCLKFENIAK